MEFILFLLIVFFIFLTAMHMKSDDGNDIKKSLREVEQLFQYLDDHFDELPEHVQRKIDETGNSVKARHGL